MGIFDMLNGDFGKLMENLADQLKESGLFDNAQLDPEQLNNAAAQAEEMLSESGISDEEFSAAAAQAQQQLAGGMFSGVDFNNAMIALNEQLESGGLNDMLSGMMEQMRSRCDEYTNLKEEELGTLDDETLYEAIRARLEREPFDEPADPFDVYTGAKRVFYIIDNFYQELSEGGLCQYLVNLPNEAPFLPDALKEAGAANRAHMLEGFLEEAGISLDALDAFHADSEQAYLEIEGKYPFDEIDDALYDTSPQLNILLAQYARAHLAEFCGDENA